MNDAQIKQIGKALETIIQVYKEAGYSVLDSDMLPRYVMQYNTCFVELGRREAHK